MKYIIYHLWIISLLFPLGMQAKVRLTSIWGDNMVLQQQSEVTFHGKASANSKITIEASWNHRKLTTRSDQHGNWNIQLPTPAAGGPYTITFSDGEALTLNNILLGEVWFCSGQSNMEMPVRGFRGQPVYGSQPWKPCWPTLRPLLRCRKLFLSFPCFWFKHPLPLPQTDCYRSLRKIRRL